MDAPHAVSPATLHRATIAALVVAVVVLLIAVLPAEYGIDPTGIGRRIGLTQMGLLKQQLALEAIEDARADSAAAADRTIVPESTPVSESDSARR